MFPLISVTMSRPINVLVTGYGRLGSVLLHTLVSPAFAGRLRPFLLARPSSLADATKRAAIDAFRPLGVQVIEGDLQANSVPELAELLRANTIQSVVCVVGGHALGLQLSLIQAAQQAGVQHFIPSEFGVDAGAMGTGGPLSGLLAGKRAAQQAVRDSGMGWTVVCSSAFSELILSTPFFGVDVANRTVTAPASFDTAISTAPMADIAQVTAQALLDPAARGVTIYVGEPITFQELTDVLERVTATQFTRAIRTKEEAQKALDGNPRDMLAAFALAFMEGKGTTWPASQTYLVQHPGPYKPTSFAQFAETSLKGK